MKFCNYNASIPIRRANEFTVCTTKKTSLHAIPFAPWPGAGNAIAFRFLEQPQSVRLAWTVKKYATWTRPAISARYSASASRSSAILWPRRPGGLAIVVHCMYHENVTEGRHAKSRRRVLIEEA